MVQRTLEFTPSKFVYVKKDFYIDEEKVRAFEVAIVQQERQDSCNVLIVRIGKCVDLPRTDYEYFDVTKVGDAFPRKVCNVCQRYLPTGQFQLNQNGKGNRPIRRPSCDDCREIIDGVNVSSADKIKWNRRKPNLVPFTCPICGKTTIPGLTSKVVLDHDHNTGKVRGWICDSCNTGIGRFKDDIGLLKKAISYLENQEKG